MKAQMQNDIHPNAKNERRKRQRDTVRKTSSKRVKREPLREYTVVLVEGTKAVARDSYVKTNASKYVIC